LAENLPKGVHDLSNDVLIILAEQGQHEACFERLVRDIMSTDGIDWHEAVKVAKEIQRENRKVLWLVTLPYKVGITVAMTTGIGAIPMVFHPGLAKWFNERFVTTDVPEPKDLETAWEVGAWTWNWMEPVLGTASFTLLALQFTRAQMKNMHLQPYTHWVKSYRANRLAELYPQYTEDIVKDFAMTSSMNPMSK